MRVDLLCSACFLLLALASEGFAERYAILVGVSKYAADGVGGAALNLAGPDQDVPALRQALIARQGFTDKNIVMLLNQAATRKAIVDRLNESIRAMKEGDYLLFYFSGHGTSAFDEKMKPVGAFIGPNSGALAPHDLQIDSAEKAAASLIIGRRDLRPLLQRLPAGSEALVILDACYSENSVKSIPPRLKGKIRGIALGTLIANANPSSQTQTVAGSGETIALSANVDRSYPYANVVALTAAAKDEPAVDIDEHSKVEGRFPTVDGKPHGAFTNSLLQALSGAGDLNHDGKITFQELHDFTRQAVQAVYAQTPQLLVPASGTLVNSPAFASENSGPGAPCQNAREASSDKVRVHLENVQGDLRSRLSQFKEVELADQGADLLIRSAPGGFDLYDTSGAMIRQFRTGETDQLLARVRAEPALRRFVGFCYPCQSFNTSLRLRPEGQSRFSPKDRMEIEGRLDRAAYLVLFNIDKSGTVSIVYPLTAEERRKKAAGETIRLGTVRPSAPFGSEYLKLLAFSGERPLDLLGCKQLANGNLNCPDIQPNSPEFEALLHFIDKPGGDGAESRIRFTTYQE